jgi:hypothetical protein
MDRSDSNLAVGNHRLSIGELRQRKNILFALQKIARRAEGRANRMFAHLDGRGARMASDIDGLATAWLEQ